MRYITIAISIFLSIFTTGCIKDVKPWDKGIHAKDTMKNSGLNNLDIGFEKHIYFSKEATRGGDGVGGGGCGCN